jgi:hypothetical protein
LFALPKTRRFADIRTALAAAFKARRVNGQPGRVPFMDSAPTCTDTPPRCNLS